jgi:hypothetical protein
MHRGTNPMTDFVKLPIKNEPAKFQELQNLLVDGCFIAGGAARFAASTNRTPAYYSDVDIFAVDQDCISAMFMKLKNIAELKSETPMSYLFVRPSPELRYDGLGLFDRFNLIRQFCGTMDTVLEEFDFSVARAGIVGDEVLVDPQFEADEKEKRLRIQHIHCPVSTNFRIAKYVQKGYKISLREMLKLFSDWESRDGSYKSRLIDLASNDQLSENEIAELEALLRID